MDRRAFLTGAAALASTLAAARALAADHAHAGAPPAAGAGAARDARLTKLVEAAGECAATGDACIRHCVDMLAKGDTALAGCLDRVLETTAVCAALERLGSYASAPAPRLAALAAAAATYCRDCASECKKHVEHHEICRICMEACDRCAEACDGIRAA